MEMSRQHMTVCRSMNFAGPKGFFGLDLNCLVSRRLCALGMSRCLDFLYAFLEAFYRATQIAANGPKLFRTENQRDKHQNNQPMPDT
jgi:hypothetical protein